MKVQYRERALADLEQIHSYLSRRSPTGASNVLRAIHAAIQQISRHPQGSERTSEPDIRVKLAGRYRYKIFYSVPDEDTVEVVHVRHASRQPWLIS